MNPTSPAFPTIGILGGGQLGRMTALAALRMGMNVRSLSPEPSGPMQGLGEATVGDWNDPAVLRAFAEGCTVVTVESEWAPADVLGEVLPGGTALWPAPATLRLVRDKGVQKSTLSEAGIPVADSARCATLDDALAIAERLGYPVILKKYRGSYDGYGNAEARTPDDLRRAWPDLAAEDGLLVEEYVPFIRELATLVARRPGGEHVVYPVVYSIQRDHRCHAVIAPAAIDVEVCEEAERVALAAVEAIGGVGITGVELFELENGHVLVNEMAPRPHNTGHYTIEACYTSQFENHLRAILDWPLGDPRMRGRCAVMVNLLGSREGTPSSNGLQDALALPGIAVHVYGKTEVRPKRKMGHLTALGRDVVEAHQRAEQAAALIRL